MKEKSLTTEELNLFTKARHNYIKNSLQRNVSEQTVVYFLRKRDCWDEVVAELEK